MGGSSSSSNSRQQTDNYAWDNRAAGTDSAITATSGAIINATQLDGGAIKAAQGIANKALATGAQTVAQATDLASKALDVTGSGFNVYANKLGDIVDKAMSVAVTTQQNAQDFATVARMDAQTTTITKLMPWIVAAAAAAFIMSRT